MMRVLVAALLVAPLRVFAASPTYPLLTETLEIDLSGLTEEETQRLLVVVNRAVDQVCTVGRTLKSGTTVTFEIADRG